MLHDPWLLDRLAGLPTETFTGRVYRATRLNLDPTTPSTSGGRWAPADGPAVLYTSFAREGALAEIAFHWGRLSPRPTKPALIHTLDVTLNRTLHLVRADLGALRVDVEQYDDPNYRRTQEIGAATAFLGHDGLIIPSARWSCENLVLFTDNLAPDADITPVEFEQVNWQEWARSVGGQSEDSE